MKSAGPEALLPCHTVSETQAGRQVTLMVFLRSPTNVFKLFILSQNVRSRGSRHFGVNHVVSRCKTTIRCSSAITRATKEYPIETALCRLSGFLQCGVSRNGTAAVLCDCTINTREQVRCTFIVGRMQMFLCRVASELSNYDSCQSVHFSVLTQLSFCLVM